MSGRTANEKLQSIRVLLGRKGRTLSDLCDQSGVSASALRLLIYGDQLNPRRIRKIERTLGVPIWTSVKQFSDLNRASDLLGFDAALATFRELRRRAIELRVSCARQMTSKADLISAILAQSKETKP